MYSQETRWLPNRLSYLSAKIPHKQEQHSMVLSMLTFSLRSCSALVHFLSIDRVFFQGNGLPQTPQGRSWSSISLSESKRDLLLMWSAVFKNPTLAAYLSQSSQYLSIFSSNYLVFPSRSKISTDRTRAEDPLSSSSAQIIQSLMYRSISAALGPIGFNNPFKLFFSFSTKSCNILRYYLQETKLVLIPLGIFLNLLALLMQAQAALNTLVCPGQGSVNISSTISRNKNQKISSLSSVQRYLNFLVVQLTQLFIREISSAEIYSLLLRLASMNLSDQSCLFSIPPKPAQIRSSSYQMIFSTSQQRYQFSSKLVCLDILGLISQPLTCSQSGQMASFQLKIMSPSSSASSAS